MPPRWSPEEDEILRAEYATVNLDDLATRLGRTVTGIHNRASNIGVTRPNPRNWSNEDTAYLIENWEHIPTREVVSHLGKTYEAVRMHASRLGLSKRPEVRGRWYAVNGDAFNVLVPETAYAAGLIASDGCITRGGRISIGSIDRAIPENLRQALAAENPIGLYTGKRGKPVHYFSTRHPQLVAALKGLGIGERKSLTLEFPPIPAPLLSHFVRGVFDGDGHASVTRGGRLVVAFISGSPPFLERMSEHIAEATGLEVRPVYPHSNGRAYLLTYHGPKALTVGEWMDAGAGTFLLPRKHAAFATYRQRHSSVV